MTEFDTLLLMGFSLGMIIGMIIGTAVTNQKWLSNAKKESRIFYNDEFYKVIGEEDYDRLLALKIVAQVKGL